MNLAESLGVVDRFIVCEADISHVGQQRELIFPDLIKKFPYPELSKVEYLPLHFDQNEFANEKSGGSLYHKIEQRIRSQFTKSIDLKPNDIVYSVDADEIIYADTYQILQRRFRKSLPFREKCFRLKMHQLFFRLDYYWKDYEFASAVATKAKAFQNQIQPQWRDQGRITEFYAGVHFSWIMDIEDMVKKLKRYAHNDIYGHFADAEILTRAVIEKKYIFDPNVKFEIVELAYDSPIYPKSFRSVFGNTHEWFSGNAAK
jgi:Glycosyltransferase family 17